MRLTSGRIKLSDSAYLTKINLCLFVKLKFKGNKELLLLIRNWVFCIVIHMLTSKH